MTHSKLATIALAIAILVAAAPALAAGGRAPSITPKTLLEEQLGPKYLLGPRTTWQAITRRDVTERTTTRVTPITAKTLQMDQLGPKHLLGR
jgi:hypothetical protein